MNTLIDRMRDATRPYLLDLFCGAGGASVGYHRAGFDVVGVDIKPQRHYPFEFFEMDAIEFLESAIANDIRFDAIHASPPCQHHSNLAAGTNGNRHDYAELIEPTRELLERAKVPYVIENVVGSPLKAPIRLCGEMFGLQVIRHRLFETNWLLFQPEHPRHRGRVAGCRHGEWFDGPYFAVYGTGGGKGTAEQWQTAMGIDWMPYKYELAEAIPPAYTEYVGHQLMAAVKERNTPYE